MVTRAGDRQTTFEDGRFVTSRFQHVGTVAQGRFYRLSAMLGRDRVLSSLSEWIRTTEESERSHGVASAQLWRGLRTAWEALGYIGGPALLLPPYFEIGIAADDDSIKTPLPTGAHRPRLGRYVVDMLHHDAEFQERIRVLLANPPGSRYVTTEYLVLTREKTLEAASKGMLEKRFQVAHTFPKGSIVAAKKGNWSTGEPRAVQTAEDWTLWIPREIERATLLEVRGRLAALTFTRDGVTPFDPSCPSVHEARYGTAGPAYAGNSLVVATDGSVKHDGSMGASACWSRPDLQPISFEVQGPPISVVPELAALAVAAENSPLDEDLTILTDSKTSLQLLIGMQRKDFPVFLHRRAERRFLERTVRALNRRADAGRVTHLCKVKGHSGDPLNYEADHHATRAAGLDPTLTELDPLAVLFYLEDRPIAWCPRLRKHLTQVSASQRFDKLRQNAISRDPRQIGRAHV